MEIQKLSTNEIIVDKQVLSKETILFQKGIVEDQLADLNLMLSYFDEE